ncbi:MAG: AI-2E family transporter [Candidatus Pacebacteria bacterium]|nr:AI-2E family transporter [Candidatus Paceibacterota bacterium]
MEKIIHEISWGSLWKVLVILAVGAAIFSVRDVLVNIFLALVISTGLNPFVDFFEGKGVPRILGALFVYIIIFVFVGLVIYAVLPIAYLELGGLTTNVMDLTGNVFNNVTVSGDIVSNLSDKFADIGKSFLPSEFSLLGVLSSLFGGISFVVTAIIISFYLSVSRDGAEWFLRAIMPEKYEDRMVSIFRRSKKRIGFWLQTQVLLSMVVGVLCFFGLWFIGVKHAFVLGLTAGVFEIVPFVGPVFAGGMAVLVALSDSYVLAIYALIVFLVIQQIESNVLIPLFMKRSVGMHPVVVLAAFMIGLKLLGFIGIILAVPTAVILQEALNDWISVKDHRRAMRGGLFS